jgi:hypothetical protein
MLRRLPGTDRQALGGWRNMGRHPILPSDQRCHDSQRAFSDFLGLRFQQKGETEVECTLALLKDLRSALGHRFFELLVGALSSLLQEYVRGSKNQNSPC